MKAAPERGSTRAKEDSMVEARIQEAPETAEEEFGLVEGPLGHLTDEVLEEKFFNAATWEQFSWGGAAVAEHRQTDDLTEIRLRKPPTSVERLDGANGRFRKPRGTITR
jgi:hypothetical protein